MPSAYSGIQVQAGLYVTFVCVRIGKTKYSSDASHVENGFFVI